MMRMKMRKHLVFLKKVPIRVLHPREYFFLMDVDQLLKKGLIQTKILLKSTTFQTTDKFKMLQIMSSSLLTHSISMSPCR